MISASIGTDKNGNMVIKVRADSRGFSIQTKQNLPQSYADKAVNMRELQKYVEECGTKRQKEIIELLLNQTTDKP